METLADLYAGKQRKKYRLDRAVAVLKSFVRRVALFGGRTVGKEVVEPQDAFVPLRRYTPHQPFKIASPEDAVSLVIGPGEDARECFIVLTLDRHLNLLEQRVIHFGTLAEQPLHPWKVFIDAITDRAAGVIVAHHCPDGLPTPHREHFMLAERLKEVGNFINIELLDHLFVTDSGFVSLQREGHL
jgi:DNA repair protein RadC